MTIFANLWWLLVLLTLVLGLLARALWNQRIEPLIGLVLTGLIFSYLSLSAKLSDHGSSWGELLPGLRLLSGVVMLTCVIQALRALNRDLKRQPALDGTGESESGLEGFAFAWDFDRCLVGICISAIFLIMFILI